MALEFDKLKSLLPLAEMEKLTNENPRHTDDLYAHTGKYVSKMHLYLDEKIQLATALGLESDDEPKRILDIGTGIGIFPWLCDKLGHSCIGTYYDKFDYYEKMWKLLAIKRPFYLDLRANRHWQLGVTEKFNVVTAHRTVFDRYPDKWTAYNWLMFIYEAERFLKRDGVLLVKTNCYDPDDEMDHHAKRLLAPFMLEGFNSTTFLIKRKDIEALLGKA